MTSLSMHPFSDAETEVLRIEVPVSTRLDLTPQLTPKSLSPGAPFWPEVCPGLGRKNLTLELRPGDLGCKPRDLKGMGRTWPPGPGGGQLCRPRFLPHGRPGVLPLLHKMLWPITSLRGHPGSCLPGDPHQWAGSLQKRFLEDSGAERASALAILWQ